jgi:TonB-linked SusC/RagA family outer membrane protein
MNSYDYARLYNEARSNDGLAPLYSEQQLAGYKSGSRIRYPDVDYYNSTFLRKRSSQARFSTQFQGGSENTRYFLNLTGTTDNSLLNVGEGKKQGNDNFRVRANVDTKISSFITLSVDLASYFGFAKNPQGDFFENASKFRPNDYPLFIPTDSIPEVSSYLLTSAFKNNGGILGGNQTYQTNVYGDLMYGGYQKVNNRINQMNSKLDIDLGSLVKGLHFIGGFNFDMTATQTIQLQNTYSVYEPIYTGSLFADVKKYKIDQINASQSVSSTDFRRRFGFYGNFEYNRTFGEHRITSNLIGYGETFNDDGIFQPEQTAHYGVRVNYGFKGKYLAEFDGAYAGSGFLPPANRFSFAPSVAAAWVISKEDFMSRFTNIDFLKLRASWGIINTDIAFTMANMFTSYLAGFTFYNAYQTTYVTHGGSYGYGGVTGDYWAQAVKYKSVANPDLSFGKREDINLGLEGSFFNNKLQLAGTYFYRNAYNDPDMLVNAYPAYLGGAFPLDNAGKNRYSGFEASMLFQKTDANFRYSIGGNIVYTESKVIEMDEPFYEDDYQKRTGQPVDAIFSYVAEGLFKDAGDIANHATQTFGEVFPGDIKYKDLNNDGVIDQKDQKAIGNYLPKIYYGINFSVGYRNFDLYVLGSGQAGADFLLSGDYYWVRGNRKYPAYLENARWTPETHETATYPRLTTQESSNNFRASSFWLRKNEWMKLHTVQLNYTLPKSILPDNFKIKNIKMYLRASNVLTFSEIQKELELNIGRAPQMRSFAIGLNANF